MKKLMTIGLCLLVCSLNGTREDNVMVLLRQRETHGHANKRKIKNAAAACKQPDLVAKLRAIDTPDDFVSCIHKEYNPSNKIAFEDSPLMDIIPAALAHATQEFKDNLLAKILNISFGRCEQLSFVALIDAGAHLKVPSQIMHIIAVAQDEYTFTRALLARGLVDPNIAIDYYSYEHEYFEKYTKLVDIYNPKLAQLLIQYGADPKAVGSKSKKTFLHLVAEGSFYNSDLLQLYLDNGVDVNAKDSCGSTPLERIILNQQSHVCSPRQHEQLEKKVSILLNNGADYLRARELVVQKLQELANNDDPAYVTKYKKIEDILYAHDIYMQSESLRTIDLKSRRDA